jgi:hypothetical protein
LQNEGLAFLVQVAHLVVLNETQPLNGNLTKEFVNLEHLNSGLHGSGRTKYVSAAPLVVSAACATSANIFVT